MRRVIELPVFGIKIKLNESADAATSGTITSDLSNTGKKPDALDGIESLILAHAIEGIDVAGEKYVFGVQTAVYAALNAADPEPEPADWGTLRAKLCEVIKEDSLDEWMLKPNKAFGGRTPEQVMLDGDSQLLWDVHHRLSSGEPG